VDINTNAASVSSWEQRFADRVLSGSNSSCAFKSDPLRNI
jgi:hypothetical protein